MSRANVIIIEIVLVWLIPGYCLGYEPLPRKIMWVAPEHLNVSELEPAGNLDSKEWVFSYVARGPVDKRSKLPGYIADLSQSASIPTGSGMEITAKPELVRVLYAPKGALSWVPVGPKKGAAEGDPLQMPRNIIAGGHFLRTNELAYICRTLLGQLVVPGFYVPSRQACTAVEGGLEQQRKKFEVLCVNEYGFLSGTFM